MDELPVQDRAKVLFLIGGCGAAALATAEPELAMAARRALRRPVTPTWPNPTIAGDGSGMVVTEAFATLKPQARACIALTTLAGATDADLACVFDCPIPDAAHRRALALRALALRVSEADPESGAALPDAATLGDILGDLAARGLAAPVGAERSAGRWPALAGLAATLTAIVVAVAWAWTRPPLGPEILEAGARLVDGGHLVRLGRGTLVDAAWSPDGSRIAVSASTGLYILDATTLRPLAHAPEAPASTLLGFSPEGDRLAEWTTSALLIREATTLSTQRVVTPEFSGETRAVAYDWPHDRLALGDEQGLRLYRAGAEERVMAGVSGLAELEFSRDGAWLAVRGSAPDLLIVNAETGVRRSVATGSYAPLAMGFSGDDRRLVALVPSGLQITDLPGGNTRFVATRAVVAPPLWINADGTRAAALDTVSGSDGAGWVTFDLGSGNETDHARLPWATHSVLARSAMDGERLLISGADGLAVWKLSGPQLAAASMDFAPPSRRVRGIPISFSAAGRALVVARPYGGLQWIDATDGRFVRAIGAGGDTVGGIAVGNTRIAADTQNGSAPGSAGSTTVSVYDVVSGLLTHLLPGARGPQFTADGRLLYLPARKDEIRQLDFSMGDSSLATVPSGTRLDAFQARADGGRVAVLTDRGLEVWSGEGRVWQAPLNRPTQDRNLLDRPLAAPADLGWVALAEPSQGVVVFDGDSGRRGPLLARPVTVTYEASLDNPLKIAASPHGEWLAIADNRAGTSPQPGSRLTVWRMPGQELALVLAGLPEPVSGLAFTTDGRHLAYSTADYTLRFADLP